MTPREISTLLGIQESNGTKLPGRALRTMAGGAEVGDAKEWAAGVANNAQRALTDPRRADYRAENEARLEIAYLALEKIRAIERAMLSALERQHNIPPGDITRHCR